VDVGSAADHANASVKRGPAVIALVRVGLNYGHMHPRHVNGVQLLADFFESAVFPAVWQGLRRQLT